VFRQHHKGIDVKGMALFHDTNGLAQNSRMIEQQGIRTISQIYREKIGCTRNIRSPIPHRLIQHPVGWGEPANPNGICQLNGHAGVRSSPQPTVYWINVRYITSISPCGWHVCCYQGTSQKIEELIAVAFRLEILDSALLMIRSVGRMHIKDR